MALRPRLSPGVPLSRGACPTYEPVRALSTYTFCQGTWRPWSRASRRRRGARDQMIASPGTRNAAVCLGALLIRTGDLLGRAI